MKNYNITTTQNSPAGKIKTTSEVSIDFSREEFTEKSTVSFDSYPPVESEIGYRDGILFIDGGPVDGFEQKWINSSVSLICFSILLAQDRDKNSSYILDGKLSDLNKILQNQLNLKELGSNSTYKFSVNRENLENHIKLEIYDENDNLMFHQTANQGSKIN